MLLQFRFKNYKSFAEDTILDMMATNIKEHNNSLIEVNGNNVLPLAAIFGANASGKSNVFSAFEAMCFDVVTTFDKEEKHFLITPYNFNQQKRNESSEFEVSININDKEYRYGFIRNQEKVFEEWLYERKFAKNTKSKEKCIYYRTYDKLKVDSNTIEEKNELCFVNSMIKSDSLLMSALGKRNKSKFCKVYEWFRSTTQMQDFSNDYDEWKSTKAVAGYLYKRQEKLDDVVALLREFDDAIVSLTIEKETDSNLNDQYKVYSIHKCENDKEIRIPFESESSGTKKIFSLATLLLFSTNIGVALFVDELDSKLHPLALRYLIRLYSNKETNKAHGQLIFSSHNLVCLDSSDLRRDEIWFVEKGNQVSNMYSLYDFKEDDCSVRSDLSFGKNYLSGRFGAVPFQKPE